MNRYNKQGVESYRDCVQSRLEELTINQKYFRDVIDGQKKKWGDKVSVPSVGFRLIEFDL